MKLVNRIKTWWKTTTPTERFLTALNVISTGAAIGSTIAAIHTRGTLEDVKIDVKLYPGGKDDPNPISLTNEDAPDFSKPVPSPYDDGRYDPYETARDLFKLLDNPKDDDILSQEETDNAKDKALQLAWDLAAREGLLEKAEGEIPCQVHD